MLNRWGTGLALGCAMLAATFNAAAQEETATKAPIAFVRADDEAKASAAATESDAAELREVTLELDRLVALHAAEHPPGQYWIGVSCEAVSDSLRSQLGLEENVGLLVNEVMDDSPAKKAGIQPHDVLIAVLRKSDSEAEERKLMEIGDLSEVVQRAEAKPLQLMLFRKGKQQTVELTPAERPKPEETRFEASFINVDVPHQGNPEKVQSLLHQLQEELGGGPRGMRLQMASPVVVAAEAQPGHVNTFIFKSMEANSLPEGMTLTITKSGNKPARIEVKKGEGQVWGANENEIDTLPPEAQGLAKAAVAGMSQPNFNIALSQPHFGWAGNVRFTQPGMPGAPVPPGVTELPTPAAHAELARQLAEHHRQLAETLTQKGDKHPETQQLKAKIDALHKSLATTTAQSAKVHGVQNASRAAAGKRVVEATGQAGQQQIERLQKQIEELTHMQAKQAEAQQQQMRELQRALEKIATKP
jgi:hypothetical protein